MSWLGRADRWMQKELGFGLRLVLVAVGLLAFTGGMVLLFMWSQRRYERTAPGELRAAQLVALPDGRAGVLVTVDVRLESRTSSSQSARLELFDPKDGHELARVVTDDTRYCADASPGLLWCETNLTGGSDVELRDAATLAVRASHAKIIAGAPPLAQQGHAALDPRTGGVWLMTADARYWQVTAPGLAGAIADELPGGCTAIGPAGSPTSGSAATSIGGLYFDGSPRATMMVSDGAEGKRAVSTTTWLHPELVLDSAAPSSPMLLDDGATVLVVHDDSIDHGTAHVQITAVGLDGASRWTTPIGVGELVAAWRVDGKLVLGLHGLAKDSALLALDPRTGQILWRRAT